MNHRGQQHRTARAQLVLATGSFADHCLRKALADAVDRGDVLRWSTVDLDAATLTVRYTATMVGGVVIDQDSVKTDAGERTIALDPPP